MAKPTGRRPGRPRKGEERGIGKNFIEAVILRKYKTALGAVQAIEELLPKMSESEQAKIHLRLLELYTKILPRELRGDGPPVIILDTSGVIRKESPVFVEGEVIEPKPDALPAAPHSTPARPVTPSSVSKRPQTFIEEEPPPPKPTTDRRYRVDTAEEIAEDSLSGAVRGPGVRGS